MTEEEALRHERDEFLQQRNRYAQLAYNLAEHIKLQQRSPLKRLTYPKHIMGQMDLARGLGGYEWPVR